MKAVAIFSHDLLPFSCTFIKEQAFALKEYEPTFFGTRKLQGGVSLSPKTVYCLAETDSTSDKLKCLRYSMGMGAPSLEKAIKTVRPKLLHAHFGTVGALAFPLARKYSLPLIITLHGYDITMRPRKFHRSDHGLRNFRHRITDLVSYNTRFIAVSNFIKEKAIKAGISEDRITRHFIGVDLSKFLFLPGPREKIILFVGRLIEKKGCEYLLRALAGLRDSHAEVRAIIVGEGTLRPRLEKLARDLRVPANFVGIKSPEEISALMSRAWCLCVPSIEASNGDAEGFGIVFIEAQACGLPVVSFKSGGVPEAVCHGTTGLLAEERNVEELTRCLLALISDGDLWSKYSAACRPWVESHFDLEKQTNELEAIYDSCWNRP
jgi:glycosyltransferase involved in cell wall biosynthesis